MILRQTKIFIDSISRGLSDSEKGEVLSTSATQKGIAENTQRKREMKIFWTKEALIRLQEIEDYISRDNPIAAIELCLIN